MEILDLLPELGDPRTILDWDLIGRMWDPLYDLLEPLIDAIGAVDNYQVS